MSEGASPLNKLKILKMRTIELTHEQIEIIEASLKMAARVTYKLFEQTAQVDKSVSLILLQKEGIITDLANSLKNGKLDV